MEIQATKESVGKSGITPEERLEQRRRALEKANAVRSEKASLKKREKEIQKRVYERYKEDLDRTEKKVFAPIPDVVEEPQVEAVAETRIEAPVKHIKIDKKRNKKVILEWSDSDSDVDDEAIQRAFKTGYKKKPSAPVVVDTKPISKEDYERTLLQARYGQTVKRVMDEQIGKQKEVLQYYHGWV